MAPGGPYRSAADDPLAGKKEVTGWGGYILFAASIMILLGIFTLIMGSVSLFDESFFTTPPSGVLVTGYHAWGVVHLVVGLFVLLAGFGLISGRSWARVMAVIVLGVNAITQLVFSSAYPIWSVLVIALDVLAIYAVTVHGRELADR
ncbi:MAG TPA: hypothetical protein VID47_06490 [Actinomycetota bacterium]|jgi:hypothetical protein